MMHKKTTSVQLNLLLFVICLSGDWSAFKKIISALNFNYWTRKTSLQQY